ncbi:MAG: tetratricopeptide repeat protein [Bacteroidales bacterium]|nr:tetratricopeptide repeat protein [Bacteroidales bacterium]
MNLQINRDTIIAFLHNKLSLEMMSLVADAIITDKCLARICLEEKIKIDARQYIDNNLTPLQNMEFGLKLKESMELLNDLTQQKQINDSLEGILLVEQLEADYMDYSASQVQESNTPRTRTIGMNLKYWLVAVSITVLLAISGEMIYHFQTQNLLENRLFTEYYAPFDYTDSYMPVNSTFTVAKQKYMDGEYANAMLIMRNLQSTTSIEVERNLFIGLSLMEIGLYGDAIDYFEKVLASHNGFEYVSQTRWYMGLCYLKLGDRGRAINTFQTIVDNNDYDCKKANRILKKLRD